MKNIDDKHWYSIEKIIDDLKEDQKKALTANSTPLEIANDIKRYENAIADLINVLEVWRETYGYPNITNLKYIHKY